MVTGSPRPSPRFRLGTREVPRCASGASLMGATFEPSSARRTSVARGNGGMRLLANCLLACANNAGLGDYRSRRRACVNQPVSQLAARLRQCIAKCSAAWRIHRNPLCSDGHLAERVGFEVTLLHRLGVFDVLLAHAAFEILRRLLLASPASARADGAGPALAAASAGDPSLVFSGGEAGWARSIG